MNMKKKLILLLPLLFVLGATNSKEENVQMHAVDVWLESVNRRQEFFSIHELWGRFLIYVTRGEKDFHLMEYIFSKARYGKVRFEVSQQLSVGRKPLRFHISPSKLRILLDPGKEDMTKPTHIRDVSGSSWEWDSRMVLIVEKDSRQTTSWIVGGASGLIQEYTYIDDRKEMTERFRVLQILDSIPQEKQQKPRIMLVSRFQRDRVEGYLGYFDIPPSWKQAILDRVEP